MAVIVLKPGVTWDDLPKAKVEKVINQDYLRSRLAELRQEWEAATDNQLGDVRVNLDLLFEELGELIEGLS